MGCWGKTLGDVGRRLGGACGTKMGNGNYYLLTNLISEDEKKVITSIVGHIERGEGNVGIQQITNENFVSPAFIVKFCKRLGFAGYRELFYYLTVQIGGINEQAGSKNPTSMLVPKLLFLWKRL